MESVQEITAAAIKIGVKDELRRDGYKKTGTHFHRVGEECIRVLNFQSHKWNTRTEGRLTINLGVHFPELHRLAGCVPFTRLPKEYDCEVRARIGKLMAPEQDFWWKVTSQTNVQRLSQELRDAWENYARPWLERNSTLENATNGMEVQRLYFRAAAARLLLGDKEGATELIRLEMRHYPRKERATRDWAQRNDLLI